MEDNHNTQEQPIDDMEATQKETLQEENNTADNKSVKSDSTQEIEEQLAVEKDKYVRLFAEFDNFKKRTQKEKLEYFTYANQDTLLSMLPILDDFERALEQMEKDETPVETIQGVQLIYNKFKQALQEKGLKQIEVQAGDAFDTDFQEAVTQVDANEDLKGKVVDVIQKGYMLGEKVIRYAKVVTGK